MNIQTKLEEFGLQPKEAKVYYILLELGQATIQELTQKSDIKRTSLYDVLARLKKSGLINETLTRGKLLYYLDDPAKFLNYWQAKEKEAKQKVSGLLNLLPVLKQLHSSRIERRPKMKIYEGRNGIRKIFDDILTCKDKEVWSIISRRDAIKAVGESFFNEFIRKRTKAKIKSFGFRTDTDAGAANASAGQKRVESEALREAFYLPAGAGFTGSIVIYDNKLAAFTSIEEKFGFILESVEITQTLKVLLKIFWNK